MESCVRALVGGTLMLVLEKLFDLIGESFTTRAPFLGTRQFLDALTQTITEQVLNAVSGGAVKSFGE